MIKKIEEFLGMKTGDITGMLVDMGIKLAVAIGVLIIGFWLANLIARALVKVMKKGKTDQSLISFLSSLTRMVIKILVVVTAITQLGVEMTSFVAILGAAGLAIGLAFSGTLSNFAGGVMILLFKPFKFGDFIKVQGEEGFVKEILIFNTILTTTDNKVIFLANGAVANGTIVNYTKAKKRRVDWSFGIAYGDDLKVARDLLMKFINEDKRILDNDEKLVVLGKLDNSSVNLTVRVWVKTDDYWEVFFEMNERVYTEFGDAGLSIPFPQMDVHLKNKEQ